MKKLTLLIALFTFVTASAHAAEPSLTSTKTMKKVQTMKKRLTPAISSKIKPGMRTVKSETTEPETAEPETTEPTEPTGTYVLGLSEIELGADPATCRTTWKVDVSNTGTVVSPAGMRVFPVIDYDEQESHGMGDLNMVDYAVNPIAAGQAQRFEGGFAPQYAHTQEFVFTLKNEAGVLDSKRITLPAESEYTIVLGELVIMGDQISIPLTNEGAAPVLPLKVYFQGKIEGQPTFVIETDSVHCIPPGETHVFNFPVSTQDLDEYRIMVYRNGNRDASVSRNYPQ